MAKEEKAPEEGDVVVKNFCRHFKPFFSNPVFFVQG